MKKIVIGKYVNTHGIKGEIRIKSNFLYKDRVFKVGNEIIIDKPYIITSYRVHKDYDMVTLEGINNINDIINLKNSLVYIDRDKYLSDDDYLDSDLIGFKVCNSNLDLIVTDISYITEKKKLLVANDKLIPFELIEDIDKNKKVITIKDVIGL